MKKLDPSPMQLLLQALTGHVYKSRDSVTCPVEGCGHITQFGRLPTHERDRHVDHLVLKFKEGEIHMKRVGGYMLCPHYRCNNALSDISSLKSHWQDLNHHLLKAEEVALFLEVNALKGVDKGIVSIEFDKPSNPDVDMVLAHPSPKLNHLPESSMSMSNPSDIQLPVQTSTRPVLADFSNLPTPVNPPIESPILAHSVGSERSICLPKRNLAVDLSGNPPSKRRKWDISVTPTPAAAQIYSFARTPVVSTGALQEAGPQFGEDDIPSAADMIDLAPATHSSLGLNATSDGAIGLDPSSEIQWPIPRHAPVTAPCALPEPFNLQSLDQIPPTNTPPTISAETTLRSRPKRLVALKPASKPLTRHCSNTVATPTLQSVQPSEPVSEPDEEYVALWMETKTDKFLAHLDCVYHCHLRMLLCKYCKIALIPDNLKNFEEHFQTHGQMNPALIQAAIEGVVAGYKFNTRFHDDPHKYLPTCLIPPIPHLAVSDGFKCPRCPYSASKSSTMRTHFSNEHKGEGCKAIPCKVQKLFAAKTSVMFPVGTALSSDTTIDRAIALLNSERFQDARMLEKKEMSSEQTGCSGPNQLTIATGWQKLKTDIPVMDLLTLVKLPTSDSCHPLARLQEHVQGYLYRIYQPLTQTPPGIRRLFRSHTLGQATKQFSMPVRNETVLRYSRELAQLIFFTYCVLQGKEKHPVLSRYQVIEPLGLQDSMHDLITALGDHDLDSTISSRCAARLDRKPPEPYEKVVHDLGNIPPGEEEIQKALHVLLYNLFTSKLPIKSRDDSLFTRFLVIYSLKPDGRFAEPGEVSPRTAHLVTCLRAVVFFEWFKTVDDELLMNAEIQHLQWTTKGPPTVFDMLQTLVGDMCSLQAFSKAPPNVDWASDNQSLTLYGERVTVEQFQDLVQESMKELSRHFHQEVLREFSGDLKIDIKSINENNSNRSVGHNFVYSDKNNLHKVNLEFIDHLVMSQTIDDHNYYDQSGWVIPAIQTWLAAVTRLRDLLLVAIYLTAGQPCRGEELVTSVLVNTTFQPRNFFFRDGRFVFNPQYHKSFTQTLCPLFAPRLLGEELSNILLKYFLWVIPTEQEMLTRVGGYSAHDISLRESHLAVCMDGVLPASHLSSMLMALAKKHFKLEHFGLRKFRQLMITMGRAHIDGSFASTVNEDDDHDEEREIFERQANHAPETAHQHYGVTSESLRATEDREYKMFFSLSEKWQKFVLLRISSVDEEKREKREMLKLPETIEGLKRDLETLKVGQEEQGKVLEEIVKEHQEFVKEHREFAKEHQEFVKEHGEMFRKLLALLESREAA